MESVPPTTPPVEAFRQVVAGRHRPHSDTTLRVDAFLRRRMDIWHHLALAVERGTLQAPATARGSMGAFLRSSLARMERTLALAQSLQQGLAELDPSDEEAARSLCLATAEEGLAALEAHREGTATLHLTLPVTCLQGPHQAYLDVQAAGAGSERRFILRLHDAVHRRHATPRGEQRGASLAIWPTAFSDEGARDAAALLMSSPCQDRATLFARFHTLAEATRAAHARVPAAYRPLATALQEGPTCVYKNHNGTVLAALNTWLQEDLGVPAAVAPNQARHLWGWLKAAERRAAAAS